MEVGVKAEGEVLCGCCCVKDGPDGSNGAEYGQLSIIHKKLF